MNKLTEHDLPPSREKIGEIYRLPTEKLSFVCSQCDFEFDLLPLFVEHVQAHLHEILTVLIGPDGSIVTKEKQEDVKLFIRYKPTVVDEDHQQLIDVKCETCNPDEGYAIGMHRKSYRDIKKSNLHILIACALFPYRRESGRRSLGDDRKYGQQPYTGIRTVFVLRLQMCATLYNGQSYAISLHSTRFPVQTLLEGLQFEE